MIFHVVMPETWAAQPAGQPYFPETFAEEGFTHLSEAHQLAGVLARYYVGAGRVLCLHINPEKLTSPLRYEVATNGEAFPHLYGGLNPEAIERIEELEA